MEIYINDFISDGFKKVCLVQEGYRNQWYYCNIDKNIMYSDHKSWIYCIVDHTGLLSPFGKIVKLGETGTPLGIKNSFLYEGEGTEVQPVKSTKSRLGRLRTGDTTDAYIRLKLSNAVKSNMISIWAKPCTVVFNQCMVAGISKEVSTTSHKDQELLYLDYIKNKTGDYPWLNAGRK